MKALFLTYDGLTDPLGGSQVLPYLVGLSKRGHEISVISFEKPDASVQSREQVRRLCMDHLIDWHPMRYRRTPPVLSTVMDIAAMRRAADRLHRRKHFDLIHCRSYLTALVGLPIKRRHGVPFLFDMRGFWPEERVDSGAWNLSNPLFKTVYRYFKRQERAFFKEAGAIVSLTRAASDEMLGRPEESRPSTVPSIIPCCVDFDHFQAPSEAGRQAARKRLGIARNAPVLAYLGSVGGSTMLEEMLRYFAAYRLKRPGARFLFITREPANVISSRAVDLGISGEEIVVLPAERDEVPFLAAAADHGIAFRRASFSGMAASPTKLGEVMALGIPMVVNASVGDVDELMADSGAGVIVEQFDGASLEAAVDELASLNVRAGHIRASARQWFDLDNGVDAYDAIYRSLGAR